jgi:tRNA (guanine37-N1)-methyltransferase
VKIDIVSIFPEYFDALSISLIGKAQDRGLLDVTVHNLRDKTQDRHRTVDAPPAGGGAGMVMKAEPWGQALDDILEPVSSASGESEGADHDDREVQPESLLVFPSPVGEVFHQGMARELAKESHLVFGCGRYEGIDQRVFDEYSARARVKLVSLGDYVLNGGEVATLAMIEAIVRLLPGVVGNPESLVEESHEGGLLEYPNYTQPAIWRGREIPDVLLGGNHRAVEQWRYQKRVELTQKLRPDMLPESLHEER